MPPHPISRFAANPALAYHQQQYQSHAAAQSHVAAHQPPLGGAHAYMNNAQLNAFQNASGGGLGGVGGLNSGGFVDGARLAFQGAGFQQQHQQQAQQQQHGSTQHALGVEYSPNVRAQPNKGRIREVWKQNLHEEMATLRKLVDHYPYIAMVGVVESGGELCGRPSLLIVDSRIRNSPVLSHGRWAASGGKVTTITNAYGQTSTCST